MGEGEIKASAPEPDVLGTVLRTRMVEGDNLWPVFLTSEHVQSKGLKKEKTFTILVILNKGCFANV